jgi:hypothetical protein
LYEKKNPQNLPILIPQMKELNKLLEVRIEELQIVYKGLGPLK